MSLVRAGSSCSNVERLDHVDDKAERVAEDEEEHDEHEADRALGLEEAVVVDRLRVRLRVAMVLPLLLGTYARPTVCWSMQAALCRM